ncbi:hypothetical protein [Thermus tengchongensis]|uniref:hypothetical protein n=1 Tax=Thermus tengchongensis TaxID=1214928 RepID=UPI0006909AC1|nr:hypothetical protein [Thermus tengchongensis]
MGLWREFWRVFRPGFATPGLFGAWVHRLEREALPLGAAFLEAVAKTVEGPGGGGALPRRLPGAASARSGSA